MKAKTLTMFAILAILVMTSIVAATADLAVSPSEFELSKNTLSDEITLTNAGTEALDITLSQNSVVFEDDDNNQVKVSLSPNNFNLAGSDSQVITATLSGDISDISPGKYKKEITVNGVDSSNNTVSKTLKVVFISSFCEAGAISEDDLEMKVDVTNKGEGEDDSWLPLDKIEVEVEVENNGEDLDKVVFEFGLIEKSSGKNVADDLIWISEDEEKVKVGNIDEDEKEKHVFEFKVAPDMGIDENDYYLMVKAYPKGDEDQVCIDYSSKLDEDFFSEISIDREDKDERQVVFDNIKIEPSTALCAEEVSLKTKLYNIGENDQEYAKVSLYNKELNLDLEKVINNLDEGDTKTIEFVFSIPEDADEKTYTLKLTAQYDYDDDYEPEEDSAYNEESEDTVSTLKVEGNCKVEKSAEISAVLEGDEADVKTGKEVTVKATVKNTGAEKTIYTIGVDRSSSFSETKEISPTTLTLDAGESGDVLITLKLDRDAEGEQVFDIVSSFDGETVKQPVSLSVAKSGFGITGAAIGESLGDNWFIWIIVAVNIILIIAIIIVAMRMAKE